MKFAAIAAAAMITATGVAANEIGATGITWGVETTAEYNVDAENMTLTSTPEIGYGLMGLDLTASTELSIYDDDFVLGDVMPTLDFKVAKSIWDNLEVYAETGYDLELEDMSDVVVGATFKF